MNNQAQMQVKPDFQPVTLGASGLLIRKCACGDTAGLRVQQSKCENKSLTSQRQARNQVGENEVPSIIHEFLGSTISRIQPKLKIGAPNDKYEQEADRVADHVMRMPIPQVQRKANLEENEDDIVQAKFRSKQTPPVIQRKCAKCEEDETLQAKSIANRSLPLLQRQIRREDKTIHSQGRGDKASKISPKIESKVQSIQQSSGHRLPLSIRSFMEPRFQENFSGVKVHTDNAAANLAHDLQARAFTIGRNIVFGRGEFQQNIPSGRKLIAHELTHVIQQNRASIQTNFGIQRVTTSPGIDESIVPPENISECVTSNKEKSEKTDDDAKNKVDRQSRKVANAVFDAKDKARKAFTNLDRVAIGRKPKLGKERRLTNTFREAFGEPTHESVNHVKKVLRTINNIEVKRSFQDALEGNATWLGCAENAYNACGVALALYANQTNASVPKHIAFCPDFFSKSKRKMEEHAFHELVHNAFDVLGINVAIDVYNFNRLFSRINSLEIPQSISQNATLSAGNSIALINPDSILGFAYGKFGGFNKDTFSRFGIQEQGKEEIGTLKTALAFMQQWVVMTLPRLQELQTEMELAMLGGQVTKWGETDSEGNSLILPFARGTATLLGGGKIDQQSNIKDCQVRPGFAIRCPEDEVQPTNAELAIVHSQVENLQQLHKSLLGEVDIPASAGSDGLVPESKEILGVSVRRVKRGKKAQAVTWSKGSRASSNSIEISDRFFALQSPGAQAGTLLHAFVPATLELSARESSQLAIFIIANGIRPDSETAFLGEIAFTPNAP